MSFRAQHIIGIVTVQTIRLIEKEIQILRRTIRYISIVSARDKETYLQGF